MKKVLLAGEGKNELGSWAAEPHYRSPEQPGAIEALLRQRAPEGWKISDAVLWKQIRKYRSGDHRNPETRAVLGLAQLAKERRFDALVFTRDRDGEKPEHAQREQDVTRGIEDAPSVIAGAPPIVGGLAVQRLESWVLATQGVRGTESMRNAEVDRRLSDMAIPPKDTAAMVAALQEADLSALPEDARSLRKWLDRAGEVLGTPPEQSGRR